MVEHDDLCCEIGGALGWVVLGVTSDVTTTQLLDGNVLYVETNVVTRYGLLESFVVHLHRLDFSGDVGGGEDDDGTRLQDTSFDSAYGHRTDTTDFVYVLEGKTQGLVCGTSRGQNGVKGLNEAFTFSLTLLALDVPSLEPGHFG
ncbi:hypothetical protein ASF40_20730 [Microbacterium sp. Leaf288]|nr:hypothetical protein ASF40_20730 [Microbacterium sp. Leaf288]